MISFSCPYCGAEFEVGDEFAGLKVRCENCECDFTVPATPSALPTAPTPATTDSGRARPPGGPLHGTVNVVNGVNDTTGRARPPGGPLHGTVNVVNGVNDTTGRARPPGGPSTSSSKLDLSAELAEFATPPATSAPPPLPAGHLSPRQRRLVADYRLMSERFTTFPLIHLERTQGNPPETYVVSYHIRGIERLRGEEVVYRDYHEVEIKLPGTYPRTPPTCRMLTPVFHPNIEPAIICIGDHWTASERLCDLVVRIGEMIAFQAHNIKSPLDGEAAMWTDLHQDELPIDSRDLTPPEN